jgi:hypothetical protein
MAAIDVYVPVYMVGADGTKAYQFAKLTGTVGFAKVPEGEVCLSSRTMTTTPAADKQPKPTP